MNLVNWITNSFSRMRAEKQGDGSYFYHVAGATIDFPYRTLFEIFKGVPHLRAIIERKASMYSNVRFVVKKTDTKEEEIDYDHELNATLTNPNKLQSWRQMLYMISLFKSIAGLAALYPGFGLTRKARGLAFIKVVDFEAYEIDTDKNKNFLVEDDLDQLIRNFIFTMENGSVLKYKPGEVLILRDTFVKYTEITSRITSNLIPIQNIYKALVARGYLIEKKGGVGIYAGSQKDSGMSVPLRPKEKKRIEDALNNHDIIGGQQNIVTDVPLKWQHTIFPTAQLMLFEEIVDDFNTLCDAWGMMRELFVGDAAYASTRSQAERDTYTNTMVPEWEDLFDTLNDGLMTAGENRRVDMDFSHIGALQKNRKDEVDVRKSESEMLMAEMDKGIIDVNEYRQMMGYEKKAV